MGGLWRGCILVALLASAAPAAADDYLAELREAEPCATVVTGESEDTGFATSTGSSVGAEAAAAGAYAQVSVGGTSCVREDAGEKSAERAQRDGERVEREIMKAERKARDTVTDAPTQGLP